MANAITKQLEKARDIQNYEGRYQITSWGRVWSNIACAYITPEETKKGYLRIRLIDGDGKRHWHKVHRLVATAFIENPERKPQINHIDGNKKNNSVTNLEWCTDAENKEHWKRNAV